MKKIIFLIISINCLSKDIILLLGGISLDRTNAKYMDKIKGALLKEGREIIDDIDIDTFKYTITQQADIVHKALIDDKGITLEDRIIIIGHSQGGLRGYELYRKYKNNLNILALFTISTPWRGARILEKVEEIIEKLNRICIILNKNGIGYNILKKRISEKIEKSEIILNKYISFLPRVIGFLDNVKSSLGTSDMKKDSPFINGLTNEVNIPIFNLIGTKTNIFDITTFKKFEEAEIGLREGKSEAIKIYDNMVAPTSGIIAAAGSTALLFPILGGFAFFVGAWAAPAAAGFTSKSNRDEIVDDIYYLKSSLDFLKNFTVNTDSMDESDLILTNYEQSLPNILSHSYLKERFDEIYGLKQEFEIENALHDSINFKVEEHKKQDKLDRRIIYNKQKTLGILKEKIKIIFNEEE